MNLIDTVPWVKGTEWNFFYVGTSIELGWKMLEASWWVDHMAVFFQLQYLSGRDDRWKQCNNELKSYANYDVWLLIYGMHSYLCRLQDFECIARYQCDLLG